MFGSALVVLKVNPLSLVGILRVSNGERGDRLQLEPLGCDFGDDW